KTWSDGLYPFNMAATYVRAAAFDVLSPELKSTGVRFARKKIDVLLAHVEAGLVNYAAVGHAGVQRAGHIEPAAAGGFIDQRRISIDIRDQHAFQSGGGQVTARQEQRRGPGHHRRGL